MEDTKTKEISNGELKAQELIKSTTAECGLTVEISQAAHHTPYFVYYFYKDRKIFQVVGDTVCAYYWIAGYKKALPPLQSGE